MNSPAGRLNKRLELQQAAEVANSYGEAVPTWSTIAIRYASIKPLQGRELFLAQQVSAQTTHKIRIRYYPGLTAKHRAVFRNRIFNFLSVLDGSDEQHVEQEIMAIEETALVIPMADFGTPEFSGLLALV